MTSKQKTTAVAELSAQLKAHDAAALASMREAQKHLRVATAIEVKLRRLQPRNIDSRVAFA